ncbi:FAD-binding domain-containing protein [Xylariaceae sp. FL0016]|nr:FAD-binding domain-containing protein [Xylariaceae sp. FL0016]
MGTAAALEALRAALPSSRFALRGTEEYETLKNETYLSGLNIDITPLCIVQPESVEEVCAFVRAIRPFVQEGQARFAIVAGGRQPARGCSNIEDGFTLHLGRLKGMEIKENTVSVAAGELWGPVYDELAKHGLGCSGSRSSKGGIGGLALTGGLSFFSSREGFICDDVINYEVVLGSGEVINANVDENPDLWRALRGGGNNLGIVTRFDMRTFKQGPMYGGSLYYPGHNFPAQVDALVSELQKPDADVETHLMVSLGYTALFGPDPVGMNQVYHTGGIEKPDVLQPFTAIETPFDKLTTLRMHTLPEASREQEGDMPKLQRSAYLNLHVKVDSATLKSGAEIWQEALEPVKGCEGLICSYTLQPYPSSLLQKSAVKGGNTLGLTPDDGPIMSIALLSYWNDGNDDRKILEAFEGALESIKRDAISKGTALDFTFMNYSAPGQDPIGSYGRENKARLQEASKKFDPEGIFQKGVPGGWKLFV